MGLSTAYANIILFVVVLSVVSVLFSVYSDNIGGASSELMAQEKGLMERLDSGVRLSSTTVSGLDIIMYAVNDGGTDLEVNCADFYVDRDWIPENNIVELTLTNVTFDPGVWNPGETLKMRTNYPIDPGLHEARVVSCNGVTGSMLFTKE